MRTQLQALARDLWWTGDPWANDIWQSLDPVLWEELHHNPIAMLDEVNLDNASATWKERAQGLLDRYAEYQAKPIATDCPSIAYFCMEFGLHEFFQIYSGGLGILAGDHIRSAGDAKLPFVGIGLLYKHGYFHQLIISGQQSAGYANYKSHKLPIDSVGFIEVPYKESTLRAQVWKVQVGHAQLLLLDADIPENDDEKRNITSALYGGDTNMRIAQEILLGIGGIRALRMLEREVDVYHLNEGHAAFLILELWIEIFSTGIPHVEAWKQIQKKCVFTTHTPVPAGHDCFYWDVVNTYLGQYRSSLQLPPGAFMSQGREDRTDLGSPLSMTVLALQGSRKANGVSKLHGQVSRDMFAKLDVQIGHITNGVHPTAWLAPELADVFGQYLPNWENNFTNGQFWTQVHNIPDEVLWEVRNTLRKKLILEARNILRKPVLHPEYLTIGFARRFATYKRGDLIFTDADRLEKILENGVQLIFAGKAHPADTLGQAVLANVLRFSRESRFRDKIIFLPDYSAHIGRLMTQGCDVWLNNPRRPREASGTSGQKAALNGNPNFSCLDGWWPEIFDGNNGWAIGDTNDWEDTGAQDLFDVESLYSTLEQDIIPAFQQPEQWVSKMKHTLQTCVPVYNTHRMVQDYLDIMYRS